MNLIPYDNPFRHMESLRHEMNELLNEGVLNYPQIFRGPRVDLYDSDHQVIASCEIPGLEKKDDVRIEIRDDVLTISGTIRRAETVQEEQMHRKERFTGHFQRSIRLPHNVSADNASASYKNGILEIKMPRSNMGNQKFIDVNFH